jgi:CRISPR-associated endoribonuclease Cas6
VHPYLRLELAVESVDAATGAGRSALAAPLLRRVLGKALIDRFCPFGRPLCEARPPAGGRPAVPRELCDLAEDCPYGVLFAASRSARPPYALYVAPPGERGGCAVEITLYGPAWRLYPWALTSFQEALRRGLGKSRQAWEVREVRRVLPDGRCERLAGGALSELPAILHPDLLGLGLEPFLAPLPVAVELLSPARLLRDGRLLPGSAPVPFDLLVARILDRFAGLYGEGASEILRPEVRGPIETEAARVPVLAEATSWLEVKDYSARSGAEMLLGGKVGRLVYGGEAARFLPILKAGEILHVGKNAASGCGRIRVLLPEPQEIQAKRLG